eukprot:gene15083-17856_t
MDRSIYDDSDDEPPVKKTRSNGTSNGMISPTMAKSPSPQTTAAVNGNGKSVEKTMEPMKIEPTNSAPPTTTTTTTTTTSSTPAKKAAVTPVKKEVKTPVKVKKEESSSEESDSSDYTSSEDESTSSEEDAPAKKKTPAKKAAVTPVKKEVKKETPAKKTPSKKKQESSESESEDDSDDDDSDDSDSDDSGKKKKKKVVKKPAATATKKKAAVKKETKPKKEAPKRKRGAKDEEDSDAGSADEDEDDGTYKWWLEKAHPDGQKWLTLSHAGPVFPPVYVPHGIKLLYGGKPVNLTPEQEEVATAYANYLDTDHVTKPIFSKNFFAGFRELLSASQRSEIKSFDKLDFSRIHKYLTDRKEARANRTKEEKDVEKAEKARIAKIHGVAMVDGHAQKVGNYMVEPPGLFLGRGAHPKTGMLKRRIMPSDVTINIGKGEPVPPSPIKGHNWKSVIHDNKVTWLAFWRESVNNGFKYVWLSASSGVKGRADMKKFEVARSLKQNISKIRSNYQDNLKSDDRQDVQLAIALYLIDKLALRVGNEKGEDEADTVGCCSLRVEHLEFPEDQKNTITLDFLGKDSMRYNNTVEIDAGVYKRLKIMLKDEEGKKKKRDENIFDSITVTNLNNHLKKQMKGLSAKVFRTFNASITLQNELAKMPSDIETVEEKLLYYTRANREVAILCNHQRAPPKSHGQAMEKIDVKIQELKDLKTLAEHELALLDKKKGHKLSESKLKELRETENKRLKEKRAKAIETNKDESKTEKQIKDDVDAKFERSRRLPDDIDKLVEKIEKYEASIKKEELQKTGKDESSTVALGTSKINYLDPRITAAWCKQVGVPIEKIFSKTLRDKFPWAEDVEEDWKF